MNTFTSSLLILALFPGLAFSQDITSKAAVTGFAEKPFENPGGNAPILKLPRNITYLANSIVNADSLNGSIKAVATVLAKGGISVKKEGKMLNAPVAPLATAYVEAINLADMAFEARQRKSVANITARQLAHMLVDFGLEIPEGKNETESFMLFLRNWTKAAIAHPDDPTSFAILFIAANNQLQSPRADLTWTAQDPDLVRFSRLELELFSAAFERMMVDPNPGFTAQSSNSESNDCGAIKAQAGDWYDPAKVVTKELTSVVLKDMITNLFGSAADNVSKGLTSVTLATKVWKFVQMFRYGTISVSLDTPNPRHKPRPSQKDEFGTLTAHAGVDKQMYDDYLKWIDKSGLKAALDINDCLSYMGLPTKTDITDVAKDAKNWRVSWNIEEGARDQALWKDGTTFSNWSHQENHLKPFGDTEARTSIQFQIMPQKADVKTGKEIRRQAVFSSKLKRGKMPEIASNMWGAGKGGYKAVEAGFQAFSSALGVTSVLVDVFGNWALEVATPKSYVTQELFETVPYGWVGTILVSASKKTSESRYSPGDDSWDRYSHSVQEQTLYEVRGSQTAPFSDNIVTGVGAAITSCEIHNNSSQGVGPDLEGCDKVPGCKGSHNVLETRSYVVSTSGSVDIETGSLVKLELFPAADYYWHVVFAKTPEEKAYWLAKLNTFELSLVVPQCEAHNAGTQTEWSTLHDYIDGKWQSVPGYPKFEIQSFDMPAPIYIDELPDPVLTGKINPNGDLPTISVDKTIKKEGSDVPIRVQINLHMEK